MNFLNELKDLGPDNLEMIGFNSDSAISIVQKIMLGVDISEIDGDFVIFSKSHRFILSSLVSAIPFYYAVLKDGTLKFDNNAINLARTLYQSNRFNSREIYSLAVLGHTIGNDSHFDGVYRVPPASLIQEYLGITHISKLTKVKIIWDEEELSSYHINVLLDQFMKCVGNSNNVHLSLSSGYDSRLSLALCLKVGIKPSIYVMGYEDSTDVQVAKAICKKYRLELEMVRIDVEDYIESGKQIAYVTSGVKTAANWHTYIYSKK